MERINLVISLYQNVIIVEKKSIQLPVNISDGRKTVLKKMRHARIAKKHGHFTGMPACKLPKRVNCIIIESLNSEKSTNNINIDAQGLEKSVKIEMEADTGTNIAVLKGAMMENLNSVQLEPTNVQIKGYDGIAKACLGKFEHNLHRSGGYKPEGQIRTKVNYSAS